MDSELTRVPISQFIENKKLTTEGSVARERPLTIILNNKELVTLLCTPVDVNYLAVGFLFSEGFIKSKTDVSKIVVDDSRGIIRLETGNTTEPETDILFKRVITSGCGRGASFYNVADLQNQVRVESQTRVSATAIMALAQDFQRRSKVYQTTHGVHSAALCDTKNILVFHEDVGRHNAVDKIVGECLMKDTVTEGRILLTSGRISSEILLKVAHRAVPILVSMSAPTDLAVKLSNELGMTTIGLVRAKKMTVYTNDWRVENAEE